MWHVRKSNIHGNGIFASKNLLAGTRIAEVAECASGGLWEMTEFGSLVNHQSNGNCELRKERNYLNYYFCLYTLTDVLKNTELVSDYKKAPFPFNKNTGGFVEK